VAREDVLDDDGKGPRARRLADPTLSPLRGADVVCMQEFVATANYRLHRLLDAAPAMGFRAAVTPAAPRLLSPAIADSGLVVLSTLPVLGARGQELRGAVGPDRLMAKGVDVVRLAAPGIALRSPSSGNPADAVALRARRPSSHRPLHIIHTHLQSGYTRTDADEVLAAKRGQLAQVAGEWRRAARAGGPRLLCGDLNWDAREPGRHEELMAVLGEPPSADLLLAPGVRPAQRPTTIKVTYDDRTGRELDVNYYARPTPPGATRLPRSVDYVIAGGGAGRIARARRAKGNCTAKGFGAAPPEQNSCGARQPSQKLLPAAAAIRYPAPRGAPAMSDHLAVRVALEVG
jgi:endonuclease/exonuclease/phosphatase family metal-dependent hydrolase